MINFNRTVTIYKLISENTVEAAMLAQADRKLDLEAQIQGEITVCHTFRCLMIDLIRLTNDGVITSLVLVFTDFDKVLD